MTEYRLDLKEEVNGNITKVLLDDARIEYEYHYRALGVV
jgi:hypothetical protein